MEWRDLIGPVIETGGFRIGSALGSRHAPEAAAELAVAFRCKTTPAAIADAMKVLAPDDLRERALSAEAKWLSAVAETRPALARTVKSVPATDLPARVRSVRAMPPVHGGPRLKRSAKDDRR